MIPTIYILTYNEELLLPYTIQFYRTRFPGCKIVVYDNESNDSTLHFANGMDCEVISYSTAGRLSDLNYQSIKNNCWKNAASEWVLIADADEHLDITAEQLAAEAAQGVTVIRSEGWMMVNHEDNTNLAGITHGFRDADTEVFYDKIMLFNRTKIGDINYNVGAHGARPSGIVNYSKNAYRMYHYAYINPDYLVNRYRMYAERMSEENKREGWGGKYLEEEGTLRRIFSQYRAISQKIL